jgi:hypothetical protein
MIGAVQLGIALCMIAYIALCYWLERDVGEIFAYAAFGVLLINMSLDWWFKRQVR